MEIYLPTIITLDVAKDREVKGKINHGWVYKYIHVCTYRVAGVDLYHFVDLIFMDACTHAHYVHSWYCIIELISQV